MVSGSGAGNRKGTGDWESMANSGIIGNVELPLNTTKYIDHGFLNTSIYHVIIPFSERYLEVY